MVMTATASPKNELTFTLTSTYTTQYYNSSTVTTGRGSNTASMTAVGGNTVTFTDGTGTGQINYGAQVSGFLPSGGKTVIDFAALSASFFDTTSNIDFSGGIKSIVIANSSRGAGNSGWGSGTTSSDMSGFYITATGSNGWTNLFNGESGNDYVLPYGTRQYSSWVGFDVVAGNSELTLIDEGAGVPYEITCVGVTGTG